MLAQNLELEHETVDVEIWATNIQIRIYKVRLPASGNNIAPVTGLPAEAFESGPPCLPTLVGRKWCLMPEEVERTPAEDGPTPDVDAESLERCDKRLAFRWV